MLRQNVDYGIKIVESISDHLAISVAIMFDQLIRIGPVVKDDQIEQFTRSFTKGNTNSYRMTFRLRTRIFVITRILLNKNYTFIITNWHQDITILIASKCNKKFMLNLARGQKWRIIMSPHCIISQRNIIMCTINYGFMK